MEHVHAELIKAWADGAKIQYLSALGVWTDTEPPSWRPDVEFRVKPTEAELLKKLMIDASEGDTVLVMFSETGQVSKNEVMALLQDTLEKLENDDASY